jgi:hypothetical protein
MLRKSKSVLAAKTGAGIAAAVAALIVTAVAPAGTSHADDAKGRCMGANACKGQSACGTEKNSCSGGNACKGQGFLELTEKECSEIPGTTFEPEKKS